MWPPHMLQEVVPSLCWKQTLASRMRIKGKPLCSHVTTAFSSDRAGEGVEASSWPSSLELRLSCCSSEEVRCCRGWWWWWRWWWWWWRCWWCWDGRGRNGPPSVQWGPPSSLDEAIWIKTSGVAEPSAKPATWNWAEADGTPTRPEKSGWGEEGEVSGFRQSNTPLSSRLLQSDPRVWLRLLLGRKEQFKHLLLEKVICC